MLLSLIFIAVLLTLSAGFAGAEAAFLSSSDIRIRTMERQGDARATLAGRLKADMRHLLGVILLAQTVCDVLAASLATVTATEAFGSFGVGIASGFMTLIVLIFVNLIPKAFASKQPTIWSLRLARPLYLLSRVLGPLVNIIDRIVVVFTGRDGRQAALGVSEEEIKTMATMGVESGTVRPTEKEMIERVFLFNDISAVDVMTPKENVVFLDGASSVADALPVMSASGYSRYPVFGRDKNDILGIVHIKDIFRHLADKPPLPIEKSLIREWTEPSPFVPRSKRLDSLLRDLQKQHTHMAIVINDLGSVDGIVTFEDLLEELVGEIADESDVDERTIKRIDRLNIIAHGDTEIREANRFFNVRLEGPSFKSLAWLILKELGTLPVKGQQVRLNPQVTATVEEMINLRINRVRLTKSEESPSDQNPNTDESR